MEHIDNVYTLLLKQGNSVKSMGQDYVIHCLNPDHEDRNPSMRVDKNDGKFHCLSCGFKGNIFRYYGVIVNNNSIAVKNLKNKLMKLKASYTGLDLPKGATPWVKPFRNISKSTLISFNVFYTDLVPELRNRIIVPIYDVTNKINHFVARHTLSDANPKYLVLPEKTDIITYPQVVNNTKSIVLVEGIFDMLKLHDCGITNTVCTFGTNTLHKTAKDKLLVYKLQGVHRIYLLFDGDSAGRKAAASLKPIIENCNFYCEVLELPDGTDPGQLEQEDITLLKNYMREQDDEDSFN